MQTPSAHIGVVRRVELEFKLARKVKGRMKTFCKYTARKRKTKVGQVHCSVRQET